MHGGREARGGERHESTIKARRGKGATSLEGRLRAAPQEGKACAVSMQVGNERVSLELGWAE